MKKIILLILAMATLTTCKKGALIQIHPPCYICTFYDLNAAPQESCGFGPTDGWNFYDAQGNHLSLKQCTKK